MEVFIDRAIALAKEAAIHNEFPVGALVVNGSEILGEGFNQKEGLHDPTAHAEVLAIRQAAHRLGDWRLTGSKIITTLEPCPMCLGAILQARVAEIIFLAHDIRWGACGTVMDFSQHSKLNHSCQLTHVPNDEVVSLMRSFFKDQKKR